MAEIFLMEDDFVLAQDYTQALSEVGHEVVLANNGTDALEICRKIPFDLAIVDIFVAKGAGYSADGGLFFIKTLRNPRNTARLNADIPIIAISGALRAHKEDGPLGTAIESGASSRMAKPIDLTALQEEVTRLLAQTR